MKVTYYSYCLRCHDNKSYQYDLRKIFYNFCKKSTKTFKSLFTNEYNEKLYLFYLHDDVYLFIVTKDNELIKAIDKEHIEHNDISLRLKENESLGFASYIILKDCYYGLGSTFYGPKNNKIIDFVNALLRHFVHDTLEFTAKAIPTSATSHEIAKMEYIGKTLFVLKPSHPLVKVIGNPLGCAFDADDYDAIEISIRPKRSKKGMPGKDFAALSKAIESEEVLKFMTRAKSEIGELVSDYYIVGHGNVSDYVSVKDEKERVNQMISRQSKNTVLEKSVQGIRNDHDIIKNSNLIDLLLPYNAESSWDRLMDVYQDEPESGGSGKHYQQS